MPLNTRNKMLFFFLTITLILALSLFVAVYMDWVWFASLGFANTYKTMLFSKSVLSLLVGLFFFLLFICNFLITRPSLLAIAQRSPKNVVRLQKPFWEVFLEGRGLLFFFFILSFFLSYLFGTVASQDWILVQQYLHAQSFGYFDPLFFKDIGFFIFKLPFYEMIYGYLIGGLTAATAIVAMIYVISSPSSFFQKELRSQITRPKLHLSLLFAMLLGVKAWGYQLDMYQLLFSKTGIVFGATYADVHGKLIAFQTLELLAAACALLVVFNIFIKQLKWVVYSILFLACSSFLLGTMYPNIIQKFRVIPNEFQMEETYIKYALEYTQKAYALDRIKRHHFPADMNLGLNELKNNEEILVNMPLWDSQPLKQAYEQLQETRLYYVFKDIDIDRYEVSGKLRQVAVSARELSTEQLPEQAKTWVNEKLKYTHGYGVVMSPINAVTTDRLPQFFIKDIPPTSIDDVPMVTRPEIYFGEETNSYAIVKTATPEFDYPSGDQNIESFYREHSGIALNSIFRKIMFALGLGDYKILLSQELSPESLLLLNRNIHERVRKLAPFLKFDDDPYLVVSEGRLFWLLDAYTTTERFPYAEPVEGWGNYARNSVKISIDAYNGNTKFYICDLDDPIINAYRHIFPSMFADMVEMPLDLRKHIRYPKDYFLLQANTYSTFHTDDPLAFYNNEDKWSIPSELLGGKKVQISPYYAILRLPGEKYSEFVLMLPYTPTKKENMVGWLCARSDGEYYGQTHMYSFPKQKLVYGPMQIEARIDQDAEISKELNLWNQRGTNTFRGNLITIPIEHSLLYIEPLYLQAEQSQLPELLRVFISYGDIVVMEKDVKSAIDKLFTTANVFTPSESGEATNNPEGPEITLEELIAGAQQTFSDAQEKLRNRDWAGYGESMQELEAILKEMSNVVPDKINNS